MARPPRSEAVPALDRKSRAALERFVSGYRVTRGKGFRLRDFDPGDTAGLKSEYKPPFIRRMAAACLVAALLSPVAAFAQEERDSAPARQQAIDELDCRTLLRLGGEERGCTLVYLHGFVGGRKAQRRLAPEALAEATDRIVDHCIEHPGARVLAVFERFRGK